MKRLFLISFLSVVCFFTYQQISFAACGGATPVFFCDANPPNPDPTGIQQSGNNNNLTFNGLPGSEIDTIPANGGDGGEAVNLGDGSDVVTIEDANYSAESVVVEARDGNDEINVSNSTLFSQGNNVLETLDGNDTYNIVNSNLLSNVIDTIFTGADNDVVNVTGSMLTCLDDDVIATSSGDDQVTAANSTLTAGPDNEQDPFDLSSGNDIATLGNELVLVNGGIDCGPDFDTIVFAMDVPEEALALFSSKIAAATVPDGSITINGLFYEWEDCELLVNQLNGVRVIRPIPTLSEWGLIAMAGLLGLAGLFFVAWRKCLTEPV